MKVPFLDLTRQAILLKDDILRCWGDILDRAQFVGGPYVEGFEQEFARACNVQNAVSVGSGTDALLFTLLALNVTMSDEIIVPVNTFIATAEAVSHCGATPVFVDIDPVSYNIDPEKIQNAITPKTRGIIAVHLYGQPAEMDAMTAIARQHDLWVVEDACQAHFAKYRGKTVGGISAATAFSFYPGKNLGGCGEGGAVTTNDDVLAHRVRRLRDHGQQKKYHHEIVGYNGRCDALQTAALSVKLKYLEEWNEKRRQHAQAYTQRLGAAGFVVPVHPGHITPVFHLYVIRIKERDKVRQVLADRGIDTALHYPVPLHLQPAYRHLGYHPGDFPIAEKCANELLSLPMYPELTNEQIDYVCENLIEIATDENPQ